MIIILQCHTDKAHSEAFVLMRTSGYFSTSDTKRITWTPPLPPPLHTLHIRDFCQGCWNNKKVRCMRMALRGDCRGRNVIAEGTDRCEGLNLTCCKSHTMCAHTCLDLSLLSGAADLPPGSSPLSAAIRPASRPCGIELISPRPGGKLCVRAAGIVMG